MRRLSNEEGELQWQRIRENGVSAQSARCLARRSPARLPPDRRAPRQELTGAHQTEWAGGGEANEEKSVKARRGGRRGRRTRSFSLGPGEAAGKKEEDRFIKGVRNRVPRSLTMDDR